MTGKEIVEEGVDAYCMGSRRSDCPYNPGTVAHAEWLFGWDQAEAIDIDDKVVNLSDRRNG